MSHGQYLFLDTRHSNKRGNGNSLDCSFNLRITVTDMDQIGLVYFNFLKPPSNLSEPLLVCTNLAVASPTIGARSIYLISKGDSHLTFRDPWFIDCAKGCYDSIVISLTPVNSNILADLSKDFLLVLQIRPRQNHARE